MSRILTDDTVLNRNNVAFVTDLAAGLTTAESDEMGFTQIKFPATLYHLEEKGEKVQVDPVFECNNNDVMDDFFINFARPDVNLAKTASNDFYQTYLDILESGRAIIYLGITRSLSLGMFTASNNAVNIIDEDHVDKNGKPLYDAAENVIVLPTASIAGGLGFFLHLFSEWYQDDTYTLREVKEKVKDLRDHTAHWFTVYDYAFMRKSGRFDIPKDFGERVGAEDEVKVKTGKQYKDAVISAAIGMHFVPIMMSPRIGKLQSMVKLVPGHARSHKYFANIFKDTAKSQDEEVWVCYGGLDAKTAAAVRKSGRITEEEEADLTEAYRHAEKVATHIRKICPNAKVNLEHRICSAICCHTGYKVFAMFFEQKDIRPDIHDLIGDDYDLSDDSYIDIAADPS